MFNRPPEWTPEETETLIRLYPTAYQEELQAAFPHRTWAAIARKAHGMGLHKNRLKPRSEVQEQKTAIVCRACGEVDPSKLCVERFRGIILRKLNICKSCHAERARIRKYNLAKGEYDEMVESQAGVCAICKQAPKSRKLVVDHCHRSGIVRALLCSSCNTLLGLAGDDEEILMNAIAYLRKYSE